jgi:DNA-binding transcriptional MerR regulator
MMATVAQELDRAERVVDNIEELEKVEEDVSDVLPGDEMPETLERIQRVRAELIDLSLPEMRISVASALLSLSVPTVNKWAELGLLSEVPGLSPRRVTTRSVLEVRPHLLRLHELGQKRNLLEAVLARVADEELLSDPRVKASLGSLAAGDVEELTDEQLAEVTARAHEEDAAAA